MILRETVVLLIGSDETTQSYAEVLPITAAETMALGQINETVSTNTYRIILPALSPADTPQTGDKIRWLGSDYQMVGACMRHHVNGQLHHLEAYIKRATG